MKKIFFNANQNYFYANFQHSFQDVVYFIILGCQTLEYKLEFVKKGFFYSGPK